MAPAFDRLLRELLRAYVYPDDLGVNLKPARDGHDYDQGAQRKVVDRGAGGGDGDGAEVRGLGGWAVRRSS